MLDFATKTSFVWDTLFPHIQGAPPPPVAKDVEAFSQYLAENNYPADRVLQRLSGPLGSGRSSPAGRSHCHTRPTSAIALAHRTRCEETTP